MKRIGIAIILVIGAASLAGRSYILSKNKIQMSDLTLANIEALANTEDSGEKGTGVCYKTITTKENSKILYCGTCTFIENATDSWISGKGEC